MRREGTPRVVPALLTELSLTKWSAKSRQRDGRASMTTSPKSTWPGSSAGADLRALLAAVKRSPIIVRLAARFLPAADLASVRKSPDVDAYVLAWIASYGHRPRRIPR